MNRHVDVTMMCVCGACVTIALWLSATGCEQVGLVIWSIILSLVVFLVGAVFIGWRRYTKRSILPVLSISLGCLALIASVALWQWPLRVTYGLSSAAFDSFAKRVRAGERLLMPQRVGVFMIRKAEVYSNDIVCLWTFPNPSGNTGFVQCRRNFVPFNLWSIVRLDDHWQFITED